MKYLPVFAWLCLIAPLAANDEIDFARDVRPILSGRCFKCHGPDAETREANLRLDDRESATSELDSGERSIVPDHPEQSSLVERVTSDDEFLRMPPPDQGPQLSAKEIDILKRWIASGAEYEKHWSFTPPRRPALPEVSNLDWPQSPIDFFVLHRLEREKLQPSSQADRATLIRRVSLDLTGLPPSVEAVEEFVNNASPSAYTDLVDSLIASPAFGERWGRVWLDLARYADSAGYADDPPRTIWMYRDWVIDAINSGMPFDQFTIEQLAGDLLDDPSEDQLIATAFHRNTMTNSEGGTDDEEFRNAAIVDRVNTSMQVWMGLTMGCAQCHTHKYDPITQAEFYRVFDIFNQSEDADRRDETPVIKRYTDELLAKRQSTETQLQQAKERLEHIQSDLKKSGKSLELPQGEILGKTLRIELPGNDKFLSLAEVQIFNADGENIALKGQATQSSTDYDGNAERAIDGNTDGHYFDANSTTHSKKENNPWWQVELPEAQKIQQIIIWNRSDSPGIGDRLNGVQVILKDAQSQPVWATVIAKTNNENKVDVPATAEKFSEADRGTFMAVMAKEAPELKQAQDRVKSLEKQLAGIQPIPTPIMKELTPDKRRTTRIQIRGNFLDLGEQVSAGVPEAFHPLESQNPNRLAFARWLIDEQNPLTARVVANRYWEALFGIGLVETSEDFGLQGELPSHPQLLDWLAIQLMQNGWNTKDLIRTIVLSATYQQDSTVTPEMAERDPRNRLLARGPRFRLSAEMIRDQALEIAGLLSHKMHGQSTNPPRPKLGLRAAFGGTTDWETSKGEDKYRRGVYTQWRRSIPYPSMDAFDAPSREVCTLRRIRTNTPLQALVTLNDPVYIEAARGLAGRMLQESPVDTDAGRLEYGFELCTARKPNSSELAVLQETLVAAREQFTQTPPKTDQTLTALHVSDAQGTEHWTIIANVLLNLDETLTRR